MFVLEALMLCLVTVRLKLKVISGTHLQLFISSLTEQWLCGCPYQRGPISAERAQDEAPAGWKLAARDTGFNPQTWGAEQIFTSNK